MTSPWERLREAAEDFVDARDEHGWRFDADSYIEPIREALAALPATPPEQPSSDAERERAIVGSLEHVALWDAINAVVEASGGDAGNTSNRRQIAVVAVEKALVALMRSAPAPQPVPDNRYRDIILWALGEVGNFPAAQHGDSIYYWRHELRRKLNEIDNATPQPVPAPPASDWRERFELAITSVAPRDRVLFYTLRDGLAALEAEVARMRKEKP